LNVLAIGERGYFPLFAFSSFLIAGELVRFLTIFTRRTVR
jgi:hypothetical protein